MTHADVASRLIANAPPRVFAHAAREAVIHRNFTTVAAMLPGVDFAVDQVGVDEWQLVGTCADGSICIWRVGP